MKSIDAWNLIIKKLNGKKENLISRKRLHSIPTGFVASSDGLHLILMGRFPQGNPVYLRLNYFDFIYPQFFAPRFDNDENTQLIVDCVCAIIDKYCIDHNLDPNKVFD